MVQRSGLGQGGSARQIGTSRTRLNTYLSAKPMLSALVMLGARRVVESRPGQR